MTDSNQVTLNIGDAICHAKWRFVASQKMIVTKKRGSFIQRRPITAEQLESLFHGFSRQFEQSYMAEPPLSFAWGVLSSMSVSNRDTVLVGGAKSIPSIGDKVCLP